MKNFRMGIAALVLIMSAVVWFAPSSAMAEGTGKKHHKHHKHTTPVPKAS